MCHLLGGHQDRVVRTQQSLSKHPPHTTWVSPIINMVAVNIQHDRTATKSLMASTEKHLQKDTAFQLDKLRNGQKTWSACWRNNPSLHLATLYLVTVFGFTLVAVNEFIKLNALQVGYQELTSRVERLETRQPVMPPPYSSESDKVW